jgi:hypothetical protein
LFIWFQQKYPGIEFRKYFAVSKRCELAAHIYLGNFPERLINLKRVISALDDLLSSSPPKVVDRILDWLYTYVKDHQDASHYIEIAQHGYHSIYHELKARHIAEIASRHKYPNGEYMLAPNSWGSHGLASIMLVSHKCFSGDLIVPLYCYNGKVKYLRRLILACITSKIDVAIYEVETKHEKRITGSARVVFIYWIGATKRESTNMHIILGLMLDLFSGRPELALELYRAVPAEHCREFVEIAEIHNILAEANTLRGSRGNTS